MADLISEIVGNRLNKIKQSQATPDTFLNQFDPRAEVSPSGRYTASNYVGTLNQGLGNILGSVAAPEQRKEAARQEQIAAEQELYKRSQDAANLALQERGEKRADTRLAFDKKVMDDAAKQKAINDQQMRNSILAQRAAENQVAEYKVADEAVRSAVEFGQAQGFLQGKDGGWVLVPPAETVLTADEEKDLPVIAKEARLLEIGKENEAKNAAYEEYAKTFSTLPDLSAMRKDAEKTQKKLYEDAILSKSKLDDYALPDMASAYKQFDKSTAESKATTEAAIKSADEAAALERQAVTGSRGSLHKEIATDFDQIKGNLEISSNNLDNYIKEMSPETQKEARSIYDRYKNKKVLEGYSDVEKRYIVGMTLKNAREMDRANGALGLPSWTDWFKGAWSDNRIDEDLPKMANSYAEFLNANKKLSEIDRRANQVRGNIAAELATQQGQANLYRAVK